MEYPHLIGDTSSIRVHFPASYVSLPVYRSVLENPIPHMKTKQIPTKRLGVLCVEIPSAKIH